MRMWSALFSASIIVIGLAYNVSAAGTFELKIRAFENRLGLDASGRCCSGDLPVRGKCPATSRCATVLRVCLMHYQSAVVADPQCTYGEVTTGVVGFNSFDVPEGDAIANFTNPIGFPFSFAWPLTFSLMVEAWHELPDQTDGDSFEDSHTLVYRVTKQGYVDAEGGWHRDERRTEAHAVMFDYRLNCDQYYYGSTCNVFCKGSSNSTFGHYECMPDGTRKCLPGWTGDYCTKAVCLPGCHDVNGYCDQPDECRCMSGWQGKFCDECQRYPHCTKGTCSDAWGCDCLEGWGGLFCNQDLNYCTNHRPCKNGGTCYNTGEGSYTCECPLGFNGTDCEIEEDGCARHPCTNGGTCRDTGHSYTCVCPRGWSGHRCETAAETCRDGPCQNGGSCFDELVGYRCECSQGFRGTNCEQRATFCQPDTCQNGGNCVNLEDDFKCMCPVGFSGKQCETNIDDCSVNPCLHGGTCQDEVNAFRCLCVPGFAGSVCHINVDDCKASPCANGGHCHDSINDFTCTCRAGFIGKDCSVNVDECVGQTCLNGGSCVDRVNAFECRCPSGWVGELCQFEGVVPAWARSVARRGASGVLTPTEPLPAQHVVLISTLSVSVPALVLISIAAILCAKYRRRRAAEKADDEARRQNEENASTGKRCFEDNMIVNALDYPSGKVKNIDDPPPYLERVKSSKQVNIDSCRSMLNTSTSSMSTYDKVDMEGSCRATSSLNVCPSSASDGLQASCSRQAPPRTGVYVIDDHMTSSRAGSACHLSDSVYATEV